MRPSSYTARNFHSGALWPGSLRLWRTSAAVRVIWRAIQSKPTARFCSLRTIVRFVRRRRPARRSAARNWQSSAKFWAGASSSSAAIMSSRVPGDARIGSAVPTGGNEVRKPRALPASAWEDAAMELLDRRTYYRAFETRDARFDGRVFVGVTSTGIYCRPICPARTPKFENCRFFASAAAAQEAGFRPCLRCRPEIAPDLAFWRGTANTVSRALALIADGALDGEHSDVEALAGRLGVGGRQLRRLFQRHLGASPIAVAQTCRVLFAKQLLHDTRLPMTEVALASGFGSVRRFNDTFRGLFRRPPSALRRKGAGTSARDGVTLRLAYRPPYDWSGMLSAVSLRAMAGH